MSYPCFRLLSFASVICSLFLTGCTLNHQVGLNTVTKPNFYIQKKVERPVYVIIDPELQNHVDSTRPSTFGGSANLYHYASGAAMSQAISNTVQAVFTKYEFVSEPMPSGLNGTALKFTLENTKSDLAFQSGGFFSTRVPATYQMNIAMRLYQLPSMDLVKKIPLSGKGMATGNKAGTKAGVEPISESVNGAVQDIADQLATFLSTEFTASRN